MRLSRNSTSSIGVGRAGRVSLLASRGSFSFATADPRILLTADGRDFSSESKAHLPLSRRRNPRRHALAPCCIGALNFLGADKALHRGFALDRSLPFHQLRSREPLGV